MLKTLAYAAPAAKSPLASTSFERREPKEHDVVIDIKAGPATATIWTNDLTHDYVHENSAYAS